MNTFTECAESDCPNPADPDRGDGLCDVCGPEADSD